MIEMADVKREDGDRSRLCWEWLDRLLAFDVGDDAM